MIRPQDRRLCIVCHCAVASILRSIRAYAIYFGAYTFSYGQFVISTERRMPFNWVLSVWIFVIVPFDAERGW